MFAQIDTIVIVLICALSVLLLSAFILLAYVCTRILDVTQRTLDSIKGSQTNQEQYMYMMRGDLNKINKDLTHFFRLNGFINMVSGERREQKFGALGRAPPRSEERSV